MIDITQLTTPRMIEIYVFICLLTMSIVHDVSSHGMLLKPPGRSSMWRFGFDVPINYNDNGLNCGGFQYQQKHGGKCGACGDPVDGPLDNDAGGKYDRGLIGRRYHAGARIDITVDLTSNHGGWFEFRLCNRHSPDYPVTQQCLDENLLEVVGSIDKRYRINASMNRHLIRTQVQLPRNITCEHCVLQWFYRAAQNRGSGPEGYDCFGCGPQEHFINCADIAISEDIVTANVTMKTHQVPVDDEVKIVDGISSKENTTGYLNVPFGNSNGGNNIRKLYNENGNANANVIRRNEDIKYTKESVMKSESNVQNNELNYASTSIADSGPFITGNIISKNGAAVTLNIEAITTRTLLVNNRYANRGDGIIFVLNGNILKHAKIEQNTQRAHVRGDNKKNIHMSGLQSEIKYPDKKPHVRSEIKQKPSRSSPINQGVNNGNMQSPIAQDDVMNSIQTAVIQSEIVKNIGRTDIQNKMSHSIQKPDGKTEFIHNVQEPNVQNDPNVHRHRSDFNNEITYNAQNSVVHIETKHNTQRADVKSKSNLNRQHFSNKAIITGDVKHNINKPIIPTVIKHDIRRPLTPVDTILTIHRPNIHALHIIKPNIGSPTFGLVADMSKETSTSKENILTNGMSVWKNDPRVLYRILRTGKVYELPAVPKCNRKRVICEGIGLYFGTDFNRYCQSTCVYNQCQSTQCVCYCEGETLKYKHNCHGLKKANDKWCLSNCHMGNCPTDLCACVK